VEERDVDRTELYLAEELFACGSGQEITPIVGIDQYVVGRGEPGPTTRQIQELYFSIVRGEVPKYRSWLRPAYAEVSAPTAVG
jgi:branched-chain amino acid aminotransferase